MTQASTTSLKAKPPTAALDVLETGMGSERALMRCLENASVSELLSIGELAHRVGGTAWRIECKCHAKLLDREHAKRGRGNKDSEGVGVKAAARAIALATGRHPSTILKDAKIYRELLQHKRARNVGLEEKSFYVIALGASDPLAALVEMAKVKGKRPDFSTRDARTLVEKMKAAKTKRAATVAIDKVKEHLDHVSRTIKYQFIAHSPKEELITRYYGDWQDDIDWERQQLKTAK
jgi:hypothetical protein